MLSVYHAADLDATLGVYWECIMSVFDEPGYSYYRVPKVLSEGQLNGQGHGLLQFVGEPDVSVASGSSTFRRKSSEYRNGAVHECAAASQSALF